MNYDNDSLPASYPSMLASTLNKIPTQATWDLRGSKLVSHHLDHEARFLDISISLFKCQGQSDAVVSLVTNGNPHKNPILERKLNKQNVLIQFEDNQLYFIHVLTPSILRLDIAIPLSPCINFNQLQHDHVITNCQHGYPFISYHYS